MTAEKTEKCMVLQWENKSVGEIGLPFVAGGRDCIPGKAGKSKSANGYEGSGSCGIY